MKPVKHLQIVVGIVERDDQILLIQRKDGNPMWDKKWEFPGGKIDEGEKPVDAVVREIGEETGLKTNKAAFLGIHEHDWHLDDHILHVTLHCFHCHVDQGEVVHEQEKAYQTQWTSAADALTYDSLEANVDILKRFILCDNIERG